MKLSLAGSNRSHPVRPAALSSRALSRGLLAVLALAIAAVAIPPASGSPAGAPTHTPTEERPTTKAVTYRNERLPDGPWSIHLLKVELHNGEYEFQTVSGGGTGVGMNTLTDQIHAFPASLGRPIAAINGDFYRTDSKPYQGDPQGLEVMHGELLSAPTEHACFWMDGDGKPRTEVVQSLFRITWPGGTTSPFGLNEERPADGAVLYSPAMGVSTGTKGGRELVLAAVENEPFLPLHVGTRTHARIVEVRESGDAPIATNHLILSLGPQMLVDAPIVKAGDKIQISTLTTPSLAGCQTALGGGPRLVVDGKPLGNWKNPTQRHPRTAIGWNQDHLYFVLVDGRQPGLSVGMSFQELAAYFIKLGCTSAVNLDGGGSASMWAFGQMVSSPSEGKERPVANGLVLVKKPKREPANP